MATIFIFKLDIGMPDVKFFIKQIGDLINQIQILSFDMTFKRHIIFTDTPKVNVVNIFNTVDFFDCFGYFL